MCEPITELEPKIQKIIELFENKNINHIYISYKYKNKK